MDEWSDNGVFTGIDEDSRKKIYPFFDRRLKFVIVPRGRDLTEEDDETHSEQSK